MSNCEQAVVQRGAETSAVAKTEAHPFTRLICFYRNAEVASIPVA